MTSWINPLYITGVLFTMADYWHWWKLSIFLIERGKISSVHNLISLATLFPFFKRNLLNMWRKGDFKMASNTSHSYFAFYCCFMLGLSDFGAWLDLHRVLVVFHLFQLLWNFNIKISKLSIILGSPFQLPSLITWQLFRALCLLACFAVVSLWPYCLPSFLCFLCVKSDPFVYFLR